MSSSTDPLLTSGLMFYNNNSVTVKMAKESMKLNICQCSSSSFIATSFEIKLTTVWYNAEMSYSLLTVAMSFLHIQLYVLSCGHLTSAPSVLFNSLFALMFPFLFLSSPAHLLLFGLHLVALEMVRQTGSGSKCLAGCLLSDALRDRETVTCV